MLCKVLKPFPYSTDGIKSVELAVGSTPNIRDDFVPGLEAERFVERLPDGAVQEAAASVVSDETEPAAAAGDGGAPVATADEGAATPADPLAWYPGDEALDRMNFGALGELLATLAINPADIKSKDDRRAAVRQHKAKIETEVAAAAEPTGS